MRHHVAPLRGACAIIERNDGKVLMHLRCSSAWVFPNCWAFLGGGILRGESAYAGLQRELLEELGCLIFGHKLFHVARHYKGGRHVIDHTFLSRWRPRQVRLLEGADLDWFSLDEALSLDTLPNHERHDLTKLRTLRRIHGTPLAA